MKLITDVQTHAQLTDTLLERIHKVITRAEQEVATVILDLPNDVTILVDTEPDMIDPNIGIGGYTDDTTTIRLSIDPSHKNLHDDELFATLVHELSHVKRAYGPSYGTTFLDYLIFEGLGVAFEEEVCGSRTYYPDYLRKTHDAKSLTETFAYMFDYDDTQYDYTDFVLGDEQKGIPKSAVYSMGLFMVEKYLVKTGKKASEVLLEEARSFT